MERRKKKNKNKEQAFGDEELKFPVSFDLKVFMDATIPDEQNKAEVAARLYDLEIPFSHWEKRLSSKGKYVCFTVSVTVNNDGIFKDLYRELKTIPGIKLAI
jgi:putative lipoic acid-binding regulatory protein